MVFNCCLGLLLVILIGYIALAVWADSININEIVPSEEVKPKEVEGKEGFMLPRHEELSDPGDNCKPLK